MLQLTADARVRQYELTFLVPASLTSTELTQATDAVAGLVKKYHLTLISQDDWGKKELAYPIKKAGTRHNQALFKHWVLEGSTTEIQAFERDLYLQGSLLRHLLVLAEAAEAAEAEQTAATVKSE